MYEPDSERNPEEDFAAIWEREGESYGYAAPVRGDIREGLILGVRSGEILFDIGAKQDAMLASREAQQLTSEDLDELAVGEKAYVYIMRVDNRTGSPIVSLAMAREFEDWQEAQNVMDRGDIVQATITGYNKGGLLCSFMSLQGFVPASQVVDLVRHQHHSSQADALEAFIGRELALKVIEVNRRRRRLIMSERAAMREWRAKERDRLMEEIAVGETRSGVVRNLCDFGAFVDLGGIDGLVHLSELSWGRVEHPSEVLQIGESVQVEVLNVDRERERIGLSLKRTQPDPWEQAGAGYAVGQTVRGRVTHLLRFGAFVELEPGIEGLVHVSELADVEPQDPSEVVHEGQDLTLVVLNVDVSRHRIGLSLRQYYDLGLDEAEMAEAQPSPDADLYDADGGAEGLLANEADAF